MSLVRYPGARLRIRVSKINFQPTKLNAFLTSSRTSRTRSLEKNFSRHIGLEEPPDFGTRTILTVFYGSGKCPSLSIAMATIATTFGQVVNRAVTMSAGMPSGPGDFPGAIFSAALRTSASVISGTSSSFSRGV